MPQYFVLALLLFLPLHTFAQPSRISVSKGLEKVFPKPRLSNESYLDKFIVDDKSSTHTYKIKYGSNDEVILVGAVGAKVKSFVRDLSGGVTISLSSKANENDGIIQLRLVTASSINLPVNSPGFEEAIKGAWFSGSSALLDNRLLFFDEPVVADAGKSLDWGNQYLGSSRKKVDDNLRAYIPNSALSYINGGAPLAASELIVRSNTGGNYNEVEKVSVTTKGDGVLLVVPVKLSKKSDFISINIAKR